MRHESPAPCCVGVACERAAFVAAAVASPLCSDDGCTQAPHLQGGSFRRASRSQQSCTCRCGHDAPEWCPCSSQSPAIFPLNIHLPLAATAPASNDPRYASRLPRPAVCPPDLCFYDGKYFQQLRAIAGVLWTGVRRHTGATVGGGERCTLPSAESSHNRCQVGDMIDHNVAASVSMGRLLRAHNTGEQMCKTLLP